MITATIRKDLLASGQQPATSAGHLKKDVCYNAIQPDELDDNEYNMIIIDPNIGDAFLVNSIDFELSDTGDLFKQPAAMSQLLKKKSGIVRTNSNYWDCECEEGYIHAKAAGNYCPRCKTFSDDQPDSRTGEIDASYEVGKDGCINVADRDFHELSDFAKSMGLAIWDNGAECGTAKYWISPIEGKEIDGTATDSLEAVRFYLNGYHWTDQR